MDGHADKDALEKQKLKELLIQDELERLDKIEQKLKDSGESAEKVSNVIAEAIAMRSGKDNMLSKALEPVVESSIKQTIDKKPQDFVNILFPLIGSTIRKSISETLNTMLSGFSRGLEQSFSLKGIKWRIEAIRSGKSFSEVVMLHTLIYSVDQVFLIHSETGLLLSHLTREGVESKDADMVSGMLTAIQDFAKDSFSNKDDNSTLNSLKMDDYTIFIERSPSIYIACVVRGTTPADFSRKLRECIELILAEYRKALMNFNGDTAPFAGVEKYLADLLDARFVYDDKKLSRKVKAIPALVLCLLLALFAYKSYSAYKMNKGIALLNAQPGILLVNVEKYWRLKPWHVVLLRDEMAPGVEKLLEDNGFKSTLLDIKSIPFVSYEPEMIERRVISKLTLPAGVSTSFSDGVFKLSGTADINWILDARQVALTTPGVVSVDLSEVADPRFEELQAKVHKIERARIRFPLGKASPVPEDADNLTEAVNDLAELEKLAKPMGITVSLAVYGHADAVGGHKLNYEISQERAKTIAYMLYARGANIPVSVFGFGSDFAAESPEDLDSRKIELKINLQQSADVDPVLNKRINEVQND